jgi:predicted SnoaL-like aldol condensation-catalyzing enzyme
MAAREHANLVRQAVDELWNQGDLDVADRLFAPNYVNHGGLIPDMVRGPEGVKLSVTVCRLAFPQLHITVESLVAQEESVALRWSAHSAPETDRRPTAAAKGSGVLDGVTFGRFSDRQIVESWTYWNREDAPGL